MKGTGGCTGRNDDGKSEPDGSAYKEYTATVEYKDKEDAKSRAEEKREILEELKRQQETYADKIKEKAEEIRSDRYARGK